MRLHQTWVALSPVKKTIMLSPNPSTITMPPGSSVGGEINLTRSGTADGADSDAVWFAISEEITTLET